MRECVRYRCEVSRKSEREGEGVCNREGERPSSAKAASVAASIRRLLMVADMEG